MNRIRRNDGKIDRVLLMLFETSVTVTYTYD